VLARESPSIFAAFAGGGDSGPSGHGGKQKREERSDDERDGSITRFPPSDGEASNWEFWARPLKQRDYLRSVTVSFEFEASFALCVVYGWIIFILMRSVSLA
jgi:hypothetical protein